MINKVFRELSVEEAQKTIKEQTQPVEDVMFRGDFKDLRAKLTGKLVWAFRRSDRAPVFVSDSGKFWEKCAVAIDIKSNNPRQVPADACPLPEDKPWLVYLGKRVVVIKEERPRLYYGKDSKDVYWSVNDDSEWTTSDCHGGLCGSDTHYAVDSRSSLAREFFPELVKSLSHWVSIAPGHNPARLTDEQVGDGFKLMPESFLDRTIDMKYLEYFSWLKHGWTPVEVGFDRYRSMHPEDTYRIPKWLDPEKLLPHVRFELEEMQQSADDKVLDVGANDLVIASSMLARLKKLQKQSNKPGIDTEMMLGVLDVVRKLDDS